jgi:hypothetical protein
MTAKVIVAPKFSIQDTTGAPLAGGKVYFYEVGTVTKKDTYSDYAATTPNDNPVILDSRGEADVYGIGLYDIKVTDSNDVLIYTFDDYRADPDSKSILHVTGGSSGTVSYSIDQLESRATDLEELPTNNIGSITGATTLNLADGELQYATMTGNVTWTFSGAPSSGKVGAVTLELTNGGAYTHTWPAGMQWQEGTEPTWTAAGMDVIEFYTRDGGTTWNGFLAGKDMS